MRPKPGAQHGRPSCTVATRTESGEDRAFKIIWVLQQRMNRRGKALGQRTSLPKGQSRFGDPTEDFLLSFADFTRDFLTKQRFGRERMLFRATNCGLDIA